MGEVGGLGDSTSLVGGEWAGEAANGKNLPFVDGVIEDNGELRRVGAV